LSFLIQRWNCGSLSLDLTSDISLDLCGDFCQFGINSGNGESLLEVAQSDSASMPRSNVIVAEGQGYSTFREEAVKEAFYARCSDEDVALARLLLQPEALAPRDTPISITDQNFGRVTRVYIECLQDRAISPSLQRKMYKATPCQKVVSIDTDHSPFLSTPEELVGHLIAL
jgi:hypothetical protein